MTISVTSPTYQEVIDEVKSLRTGLGTPSSAVETRLAAVETEQAKLVNDDVEFAEGKAFTNNTAFDMFTVPVAVGAGVAVEVEATVWISDGTDFQLITLPAHVKAVNKAGTVTAVVTELIGDLVAASAGTLTLAIAAAEGADNVLDVSMTAVSSLTPTVLLLNWRARVLYGNVAITQVNADA